MLFFVNIPEENFVNIGRQYFDTNPTNIPVTNDAVSMNGKYPTIFIFSTIILATINCPILCPIAPMILTPIRENPFILLAKYIHIKLKYAPPALNNKYDKGPVKIEDNIILIVNIIQVSFNPKIINDISVIIFDKPNLAPGKIAISGFGI